MLEKKIVGKFQVKRKSRKGGKSVTKVKQERERERAINDIALVEAKGAEELAKDRVRVWWIKGWGKRIRDGAAGNVDDSDCG